MAAPAVLLLVKKKLIIKLVKKVAPIVIGLLILAVGGLMTLVVFIISFLSGQAGASTLPMGQIEGVPVIWQQAFHSAATKIKETHPECGATPGITTAIAFFESNFGTSEITTINGRRELVTTAPNGDVSPGIRAYAPIERDYEDGVKDGDPDQDWAVGPLQILPSTFYGFRNGGTLERPATVPGGYGLDGNNDGIYNVHNVFDAALTALNILCANSPTGSLTGPDGKIDSAALGDAFVSYCGSQCGDRTTKALEYDALYEQAALTGVNAIGLPPGANGGDPSACPQDSQIPGGTFRISGSANALCVKSVMEARSPQAGAAIIWAFHHLGRPYQRPDRGGSCHGSRTGPGYDCSGFTTSAYKETGTNVGGNPTTATMRSGSWSQGIPIDASQARPGDLMLPSTGHVVMILADGNIVHTNACGDVSHVRRLYNGTFMRYYAIRV